MGGRLAGKVAVVTSAALRDWPAAGAFCFLWHGPEGLASEAGRRRPRAAKAFERIVF